MHLVQENVELKWVGSERRAGVRVRGEGGGMSGFCAWLVTDFKMEKAPVFLLSEKELAPDGATTG